MAKSIHKRRHQKDIRFLAGVWFDLCERLAVGKRVAVSLFDQLVSHYAEEGRSYHDLGHVRECLEVLEANADMAEDLDALRWATFFHDAIYDTTVADPLNVAESAALGVEGTVAAGLSGAFAARTRVLVMATAHGEAALTSPDERLIADVDLVVLAWPYETFCEYGERIRMEYLWAGDAEYREGRAAFFEIMLAKPRLYLTDEFRERYEAEARDNMTRALAEIRSAS
jgi:predicted metal-dependent HD superfamily phosphohydrolase